MQPCASTPHIVKSLCKALEMNVAGGRRGRRGFATTVQRARPVVAERGIRRATLTMGSQTVEGWKSITFLIINNIH